MLRGACTQLIFEEEKALENEWHTGDEYDNRLWKIERLKRFKKYVELHREFNE
ncbi:hypothetical protein HFTV1-gp12 [Haloferax tailed virus 1]|uniref:Uncharacterized protein n=1 Tax=Haloferax tailed virus 1 TaxID=2507575 RepID=A0A410N703_HFTV1|nr:hypothetical protein M1M17_gp12 [Haloferax tailed virus 1]QAS68845.1 hypothetical protein HFTV1-gp12 [Haloferax tailed virus 1]